VEAEISPAGARSGDTAPPPRCRGSRREIRSGEGRRLFGRHGMSEHVQNPSCVRARITRARIVSNIIGNARKKSSRPSVGFRSRTFAAHQAARAACCASDSKGFPIDRLGEILQLLNRWIGHEWRHSSLAAVSNLARV